MLDKPDCWLSETYDRSFGPRSQWAALRKLFKGQPITDDDAEWLRQTTLDEVDGRMVDVLENWKAANAAQETEDNSVVVTQENGVAAKNTAAVIGDLFADIGKEIEQIKTGQLSTQRANEIAKFRAMQLRSMELVLQAGHLEVKARGLNKDGRT